MTEHKTIANTAEQRDTRVRQALAAELSVAERQISATVALLDDGATVPFIARYRKEVTGGLDDTQLRTLAERLTYLRDLEERRDTVIAAVRELGKLNRDLEQRFLAADTKQRLEDLYQPFKPKRRTKAQAAREAGLEPLAVKLWRKPFSDPEREAHKFVKGEIATPEAALEGAALILVDHFAEDADLVGYLRDGLWRHGILRSRVAKGKETEGARFEDYFDYHERIQRIPSHRALAMLRGAREDVLKLTLLSDTEQIESPRARSSCEDRIARHHRIADRGRPADAWLLKVVHDTWKRKLQPQLETELLGRLRESAETEAIRVFGRNLGDLLMTAPAGAQVTMGLDPGLRTGVKVAVVDATGKPLATDTIYPHQPQRRESEAKKTLADLCRKHRVTLIAIGNGTASRETDRIVADLLSEHGLEAQKVMVNEAGASVYSASELAAGELPNMDVSLRGAVSIARRLQDPLAELVKIEPKAIGVGQYQHDVNQKQLTEALGAVVEDRVNAVGVDLNTASPALLTHIAGLNTTLATNIVTWRNQQGRFSDRAQLLKVPRLGPKAFEQAAGFLRIPKGANPLDASAVHPEAYPVVTRIAQKTGKQVPQLLADTTLIRSLNPNDFTDTRFGLPTVKDILAELEKPGRDPRGHFRTATFKEGVETIGDLQEGMMLEGTVTNVTNFGAFVDIGVHQDGLVHISELADRYISDPHQVVKAGDVVKTKVLSVDQRRKRIALSMKIG